MKVVGLMSGTSADGLDIALCDVADTSDGLQAQVVAGTTIAFSDELRRQILTACDPVASHTPLLSALHTDFGIFVGQQVKAFLDAYGLSADLVASHGQTVWHGVAESGEVTSTLQIGSGAYIAEITGITTIHDFRSRDIAAGGQGAPLTAYVDHLLLTHPSKTRAIQNIGGIGNVSIIPPRNSDQAMMAFDTGPGNVLMDSAMTILSDGKLHYDNNGTMARSGTVDMGWLEELLQHDYYHRPPPKTTGRELFSPSLAQNYIQQGRDRHLTDDDIMATLTAVTAFSIVHAYQTHVPYAIDEIIIGGGGAHNQTLLEMLQAQCGEIPVIRHEALNVNSDYKEALVFAVLGYLTWHNRVGTVPEQTGARHGSVLGTITPSSNYLLLLQQLMRDLNLC